MMAKEIKIEIPDYWHAVATEASEQKESKVEQTNDRLLERYVKKTFQVINYINEMQLPAFQNQIRLITKRSFNSVAFLTHIAEKEVIEHAHILVFSINFEAAKLIDNLIREQKIKRAHIVISNIRNYGHRDKERAVKELFIHNPSCTLSYFSTHCKIIAMRTNQGNHYVVEGSGNLTYNSRVEQYVIDNDRKLFDFTINWVTEIENFLSTNNKKEYQRYA